MKKFAPLALAMLLTLALIAPLADTASAHEAVPHYNACSSGRHLDSGPVYTLPGDGSFQFALYTQSWLDSGGVYCGVKQPVMHEWQTEGMPGASDEPLSYQSLGLWIGSTNLGTWTWSCPGYNNCFAQNNWWYGPDIHNLSCSSAVYPYGEIDEAGGVGEFRIGQLYNSDYEGTAAAGYTMNYC